MTDARPFPPSKMKSYPSTCAICGGAIKEGIVTLIIPPADQPARLVHGVPAGVCELCGEQYFRPEVLDRIEQTVSQPPVGSEEIAVWEYNATA